MTSLKNKNKLDSSLDVLAEIDVDDAFVDYFSHSFSTQVSRFLQGLMLFLPLHVFVISMLYTYLLIAPPCFISSDRAGNPFSRPRCVDHFTKDIPTRSELTGHGAGWKIIFRRFSRRCYRRRRREKNGSGKLSPHRRRSAEGDEKILGVSRNLFLAGEYEALRV